MSSSSHKYYIRISYYYIYILPASLLDLLPIVKLYGFLVRKIHVKNSLPTEMALIFVRDKYGVVLYSCPNFTLGFKLFFLVKCARTYVWLHLGHQQEQGSGAGGHKWTLDNTRGHNNFFFSK